MFRRRTASLVVLGLAVAAFAAAADGFVLLRQAKANDEHQYRQELTLKAEGTEIVFTSKVTERITGVDGDTIVSELTSRLTSLKAAGEEIEVPDGDETTEVTTYTTKNTGQVLKLESKSAGEDEDAEENTKENFRMAHVGSLIVDATARKVGDKWSVETKENDQGARATTLSYEILGEETVAGKDGLKVKVEAKETEGDNPIEITGTYWVAKVGGLLLKADLEVKNLPIMGEVVDAKLVSELVP